MEAFTETLESAVVDCADVFLKNPNQRVVVCYDGERRVPKQVMTTFVDGPTDTETFQLHRGVTGLGIRKGTRAALDQELAVAGRWTRA